MSRRIATPELGGATALLLHRPHATTQALARQLAAIGLRALPCWPHLDAAALSADFVFFDADQCHDEMFPWRPGEAPMPMIALIGSEAPGRIEWALGQGADAHLLKPIGAGGVYSALLIARQGFEARRAAADEIAAFTVLTAAVLGWNELLSASGLIAVASSIDSSSQSLASNCSPAGSTSTTPMRPSLAILGNPVPRQFAAESADKPQK